MAGLHFDETASDEGGVETTDHGTVLVEYHLEQGVLVVVGVGATTDDVMVCLILMYVAEFRTAHPKDGVEPAETCQHLDEPQFIFRGKLYRYDTWTEKQLRELSRSQDRR